MRSSSRRAYALLCIPALLLGACDSDPDVGPTPFVRPGAGGSAGSSAGGSAGAAGASGSAGGGGAGKSGVVDSDGDGVVDRDDCAPSDPARARYHGVLFEDRDHDGYTRGGPVKACLGANEDPAEAGFAIRSQGKDCDDANPQVNNPIISYLDGDGDGVGIGEAEMRCLPWPLPAGYAPAGGDCDDADPSRWQELVYSYVDADGDGMMLALGGVLCAGLELPAGYAYEASGPVGDCNDADPGVWLSQTLFADSDGDGVGAGSAQTFCTGGSLVGFSPAGSDCAPDDAAAWQTLAYGYRDADGDGFTVSAPGTLCVGAGLPQGYLTSPHGNDCDDADAAVYVALVGHIDADGDGVGAGTQLLFCTAGALPTGYAGAGTDCAPDDATRWQTLAYAHLDGDGDGATTPAAGSLCAGAALPPPYAAQPSGNDCDDADPSRTRWAVLYPDADGDGVGADPRQVLCLGAEQPPGLSIYGDDIDDADPEVFEDEDEELLVLLF